jgi:uncharacterized protein
MEPIEQATILWQRLDRPGYEAARLRSAGGEHVLRGAAVFAHEGAACALAYRIVCDARWLTRTASVEGFVGERSIAVQIAVDDAGVWRQDGAPQPALAGCLDVDLNFSPSTNLLPIRRLELRDPTGPEPWPAGSPGPTPSPGAATGASEAAVRAAWLRFPSFALEPLEQTYRRLDASTYRYSSAGGRFVRDLPVDGAGFVIHYPDFWRATGMEIRGG